MDTMGGLVDKLFTVDSKVWNNQEFLYKIRRMSFDEFCTEYLHNADSLKNLWDAIKKICDLNIQRSDLIDEIDKTLIEMIKSGVNGEVMDKFIQRKHKTL